MILAFRLNTDRNRGAVQGKRTKPPKAPWKGKMGVWLVGFLGNNMKCRPVRKDFWFTTPRRTSSAACLVRSLAPRLPRERTPVSSLRFRSDHPSGHVIGAGSVQSPFEKCA